jgi:uncharacterized Zn finger protein
MPTFTESDIRAGANARSFSRGEAYYRDGAVDELTRRGDTITAAVQGSDYEPYEVVVNLHPDGGIHGADCTCPYEQGGYCKHIVAVLLAVLRDQEEIDVRPDLETLLAGLTEAQLRRILRTVAEGNPAFADAVEQEVKWLKMEPAPGAAPSAPAAISVDIAAIRRELRKDLRHLDASDHGYRAGYYYDDSFEVDLDPVLKPHLATIDALLAAGDPATATTVLTAVIEEWGEGISSLDDWISEGNEDTFAQATQELDTRLAEALLSQDLSEEQREQWQARLDDWADDVVSLEIAAAAVEQGWDYPPLVAAMQGHITEQGAWEEERPFWADDLALVRLQILQRQGRSQEYINLAAAEGQFGLAAQMLARTGQVAQAVEEAIQFLTEPREILALAQLLVELGEPGAAATVAAHGLDQTERVYKTELARWTAALAQQTGDQALALRAAEVAFLNSYALDDYQAAERLAGASWPEVKARLLAGLGESNAYGKVNIYLYEHMLVAAMAEADRVTFGVDLERVIQATRAEYPDWGIGKCKRLAESIMSAGKSDSYDEAVAWLRLAREALLLHDRQAEWQAYLAQLLEIHARKYKLVPMLRAIR